MILWRNKCYMEWRTRVVEEAAIEMEAAEFGNRRCW